MSNIAVGQKIRKLRKDRKLTLLDVAGHEFTKGYISHVELGKVNPSFKVLSHIADKLNVSVDVLLASENNQEHLLALIEDKLESKSYKAIIELTSKIDRTTSTPFSRKITLSLIKSNYYLGHYDSCKILAQEMILYKEDWGLSYKLEAYSFLALVLFSEASYLEVIELYDRIFDYAFKNELGTSKLLANMYLNKATAIQNLKRYDDAILVYQEALEFSRVNDCKATSLDVYIRLGYCYYKTGQMDIAKKNIYNGLRVNQILNDKLPQAEALYILSQIMMDEDHLKAAELIALKALTFFNEANQLQGKLETGLALVNIYKKSNQTHLAIDKLIECHDLVSFNKTKNIDTKLLNELQVLSFEFGLE